MTIRKSITAAMTAQGVTIAALARQVGITRAHLSRFVSGKANVSSATADKLLAALGLTITTRSDR